MGQLIKGALVFGVALAMHGGITFMSPASAEAEGCKEWGLGEASEPHQQIGLVVRDLAPLNEHIHAVQDTRCG